jgi:tripartite-type tricarboxylate transporter receptor subunit TctC
MESDAQPNPRRRRLILAAPAIALAYVAPCRAATFPERQVKIIVAYPPGGSADIQARLLAAHLAKDAGWQVLVENRAGAAGVIGSTAAAKAAPDGYTLVLGTGATHGSFASLYPALPYDPVKDFAPITNVSTLTSLFVVHPSVPARTVRELIEYAKANPGKLAFGSGGNGSNAHLAMEIFNHMAGTKMLHVPYKGNPPALQDLVAGRVQVMVANMPSVVPFLGSGNRLVALAVAAPRRSPLLPALPTVAEAQLTGYNADVWQGLLAPAGTPAAIIATLNAEVRKVMKKPEVLEALEKMGAAPADNTPEEFSLQIRADVKRYAEVVKAIGLTLD